VEKIYDQMGWLEQWMYTNSYNFLHELREGREKQLENNQKEKASATLEVMNDVYEKIRRVEFEKYGWEKPIYQKIREYRPSGKAGRIKKRKLVSAIEQVAEKINQQVRNNYSYGEE
jgi:hypothetical protein